MTVGAGQVGADGKRRVHPSGKCIVSSVEGEECCCKCFLLVPCDPNNASIITDTDLSAHVGKVVAIDSKCYTVKRIGCKDPEAVTVDAVYDSCSACHVVYPPPRDPCDCPTGTCNLCGECPPDPYQATISGIIDAGCRNSTRLTTGADNANGTHELPEGSCAWFKVIEDMIVDAVYSQANCQGSITQGPNLFNGNVWVRKKDATTFEIEVAATSPTPGVLLFQATVTVPANYCGHLTVENELEAADAFTTKTSLRTGNNYLVIGYGGTIFLNPCEEELEP